MKNFIKIGFIGIVLMFVASTNGYAQKTYPRFGTASNQDNTYRGLTNSLVYVADTGGATVDTLTILPSTYTNFVDVTLKDSCVLAFKSIGNSFYGDEIIVNIHATAGSGKFINFLGYSKLASKWGMASTGTKISVATSSTATLTFVFDGVLWNEKSRVIR